jgi:hypothetical protein
MDVRDDIWLLLGAALGAIVALAIPYLINVIARQLRKPDIALNPTTPSPRKGSRDATGSE